MKKKTYTIVTIATITRSYSVQAFSEEDAEKKFYSAKQVECELFFEEEESEEIDYIEEID